jgi:hypothetical protein
MNGKERKEAGMELVATSGDEELVAQKEAYWAAEVAWVERINSPVIFTVEDIRKDLGDPPGNYRVMGSNTGQLVKKKLIKSVGRKHADREKSNDCWIELYVKTEFYDAYLAQQLNEVEAARKLLEKHEVTLLEAAQLVADIFSMPKSVRQKIAALLER